MTGYWSQILHPHCSASCLWFSEISFLMSNWMHFVSWFWCILMYFPILSQRFPTLPNFLAPIIDHHCILLTTAWSAWSGWGQLGWTFCGLHGLWSSDHRCRESVGVFAHHEEIIHCITTEARWTQLGNNIELIIITWDRLQIHNDHQWSVSDQWRYL